MGPNGLLDIAGDIILDLGVPDAQAQHDLQLIQPIIIQEEKRAIGTDLWRLINI
jgi:hypothetical protein